MGGMVNPAAAKALAEAVEAVAQPVAFVCVNVGPRYGMEYVAVLRDMVLRNCSKLERPHAWFCVTDRPTELPPGVNAIPSVPGLPGWWQKLALFSPHMPWAEGTRVVYFDLDVCITGRLEDLVERKGIIRDFHWPMFNSSVMVWDHGEHRDVWACYSMNPEIIRAPSPPEIAPLLPRGQVNGGDQEFITNVSKVGKEPWEPFPREWFASYRYCVSWPPSGCKAVIFHGDPKPAAVDYGWVPNIWKQGGYTSFPEFKGANTTEDHRMANVAAACERDLPWFTGFKDEGQTCVIVGGAPSLKTTISDIRWHSRQKKTRVIALNNSWRTLVANGITPHACVMVDARAENAEFLKDAPKSMRLLLASQCHPDVFDAAEATGADVTIWHCGFGDNSPLWEALEPWQESRPIILVPGGSTVALRAMWLAVFSGFRKLHMYGVDGCYADDGSHHAYAQPLNDGEQVVEVARGDKRYRCAPWMARQAMEFEDTWRALRSFRDFDDKPAPVSVMVHGTGLLPDIGRGLREGERKAA